MSLKATIFSSSYTNSAGTSFLTIFFFGGIYAGDNFGFDTQGLLIFGIVLNVAAGL